MLPAKDVDMKFDKKRIYEEDKKYKCRGRKLKMKKKAPSSVRVKQVPLTVRKGDEKEVKEMEIKIEKAKLN